MRTAIVIPTTHRMLPTLPSAVRSYLNHGYIVVIAVNGCAVTDGEAVEDAFRLEMGDLHVIYVGPTANPYPARNAAMTYAFDRLGVGACLLTDSDCLPSDDFFSVLPKYLNEKAMVAGRTFTAIPTEGRYATRHFEWLAAKDFECYDGFTPPTFTVGSNMIVGVEVFRQLGFMRESLMSGGDGEYGERHESLIGPVTVASDLIVTKTIYTMDFIGICEKQLRRARCIADKYRPDETAVIEGLRNALKAHIEALAVVETPADLERNYDVFIDKLFQVMMWYGQLSNHLDKK